MLARGESAAALFRTVFLLFPLLFLFSLFPLFLFIMPLLFLVFLLVRVDAAFSGAELATSRCSVGLMFVFLMTAFVFLGRSLVDAPVLFRQLEMTKIENSKHV